MSACISRHGEFSDHELDDNYTCTLCGVLVEHAIVAVLKDYRARVDELEAQAVSCSCQAWPPDGPSPDCPVHGAVRALNELNVAHAKLAQDYARVMTERDNALSENARLRQTKVGNARRDDQ